MHGDRTFSWFLKYANRQKNKTDRETDTLVTHNTSLCGRGRSNSKEQLQNVRNFTDF